MKKKELRRLHKIDIVEFTDRAAHTHCSICLVWWVGNNWRQHIQSEEHILKQLSI